MTLETLRAVLVNIFKSSYLGKELDVVWHAGEPLTVPLEFYQEAARLTHELAPSHCKVSHSIQTNGMLINDEWCAFFLENDVRVGVSIDGPPDIHDVHRQTRNRRGTFDQTMRGIQKLRLNKTDFHVITVLTNENIHIPDRMFNFYDENDLRHICFNIEETDGVNLSLTLSAPHSIDDYYRFIDAFIFLCERSGTIWVIREFEQMKSAIFREGNTPFCNPQVQPFGIVSVDVNGGFTTFSPEFLGLNHPRYGDFLIGDLTSGPIEQAVQNERFQRLAQEVAAGVSVCEQECQYFSVCGGGAPANKLGELGRMDVGVTRFCKCTTMANADLVLSMIDRSIAGLHPFQS